MHPGRDFMTDIAEFDLHPKRILWRAEFPTSIRSDGDAVIFTVPFRAYKLEGNLIADPARSPRNHELRAEALANGSLRLSISYEGAEPAAAGPLSGTAGVGGRTLRRYRRTFWPPGPLGAYGRAGEYRRAGGE